MFTVVVCPASYHVHFILFLIFLSWITHGCEEMPEPVVCATQETGTDGSNQVNKSICFLEVFLSMYALRCKESAIEMNPRALQAAVAMQDAADIAKRDLSDSDTTTRGVTYKLNGVPLGVSGSQALFPAFACMPLVKLDLNDCYLGDAGTRTLAEVMSTSSRCGTMIRDIHLSGVGIVDASSLTCVMTAAHQLELLDVSRNRIGTQPHGLAVLCASMHHHKSLREVNLGDNLISGSCVVTIRAIAEWVVCAGHDDVLHRIDLRFNTLGILREFGGVVIPSRTNLTHFIYGAHPLVDALFLNNTLEYFELYGNALSADVIEVLEAKLAVNRRTKKTIQKSHTQLTCNKG
ncbi:hypothetical protein BCY84_10587 [Trypanosoma cruzi cruzi]|nr:hypothetical protein BCY84_10587 [Trypanosoma cruzi cruzi]